MRITGSDNSNIVDRQSKTTGRTTKSEEKSPATSAVVVSIGDVATEAGAVSERMSAEITTRLEAVRNQLQSDNYPIDFERLASRIVEDELARNGDVN